HMLRTLGEERLVDVTILDCFWYHMYLNGSLKVMEWIKEKGIFSKTYTFVPIMDGFVKDLYHTQGKMGSSRCIGSIPLLLPKVLVDEVKRSLFSEKLLEFLNQQQENNLDMERSE
ncbi:hypothetical protein Taro_020088, partial [Colocasia esculenta]|nr:hypothetical protein [Colocasia esculenta]